MATDSKLRRVPTQERSRRRLTAIVDAAAEIFAESGYEAATMEAIAKRADTSIGSVYQFFPNKLAVFRAMAQRCIARTRDTFVEVLGDDPVSRPWEELADGMIDAFAVMVRQDAGSRALWRNLSLYSEYAKDDDAMIRTFVDSAALIIAAHGHDLKPAEANRVATAAVHAVNGMLIALIRESPQRSQALLEEAKVMIRSYLANYLAPTLAS